MKQAASLFVVIALTLLFNACNWSSEQGPVSMNSIQKAQQRGSFPTDEYKIIDITSHNIHEFNKAPVFSVNVLPRVDFSKTYTDAIRPYDQLILQVVDAGNDSGITSQDKLPAQFGPIEVPQTGRISIPYVGEFNVLGKEIADVQNEIQEAYTPVFNTARVSLNRTSRVPLTANVIGIANAPGQQTIDRKGVTLADLVAKSSGTSQEPFTCEYILHRGQQSYKLNNMELTTKNLLAQDSDILEIRKSSDRSITLLGAVNRQDHTRFPTTAANSMTSSERVVASGQIAPISVVSLSSAKRQPTPPTSTALTYAIPLVSSPPAAFLFTVMTSSTSPRHL